jgi:hypothetical protein
MGFYPAWLKKAKGLAQVFTAQGSREHIDALLPSLLDYLERAGGATDCSIKEERVARYWISGPDVKLAPVIQRIMWLGRPTKTA